MEIMKLYYFMQVCDCESISQAGRKLYMSQQGVSRIINSLEEELQTVLFVRTAKGVELTQEGKLLKKYAVQICGNYSQLLEEMDRMKKSVGHLSVAITSGILFAANDGLTSLEQQEVELIDAYDYQCDEMVLDGKVSMGISVEPVDHTLFDVTALTSYPLYLVCHKDHPLAGKDAVTFSDLDGQQLYILGRHYKANLMLRAELSTHVVPDLKISETGYIMNIYQRCQSFGCVGLVVKYSHSGAEQYDCRTILLKEPVCWEPCLICRKNHPLSKQEKRLKKQIVSIFQ